MDKIEYLSPNAWNQWHTELLQSTVNRAYKRVPFYRKKMDEMGIGPDDIGSLEDIVKLPFLSRDELSENYPYGLFAVPLRDIVRIHTLRSGLTNPIAIGLTRQDLKRRVELAARFFKTTGITQEDIVQICLDPGLSLHGQELKEGAEELGALVIPPDPVSTFTRIRVMIDFKTTTLVTSPSYGLHLLEVFKEKNMPIGALNLRKLILLGEHLSSDARSVFEKELDVEMRATYGIFEASGPTMAYECECRCGLHLALDHIIPEIIDPKTSEPVEDGKEGELVITTVTTRANPLIRFRTGDFTKLIKETCSCGRTTWRMEPVRKRTDDLISVRGIKVSPSNISHLLAEEAKGKPVTSLVVLDKWKHLTQIRILIAMDENIFTGDLPELHNWIRRCEERFQETLGISCRIEPVERKRILPFLEKGKVVITREDFEKTCAYT